ncbi:hypothetical protein [Flocculibacter collagenilyticus]|uniref:hypothetical protein n=1 Tax=Flocculibacter collagenilyticus TaxID=2744479 RepID=UPI0018F47E3E|nr:hypothetical protein [Flocculibacter collagenilyticus]
MKKIIIALTSLVVLPFTSHAITFPLIADVAVSTQGKPGLTTQLYARFIESNWGMSAGYTMIQDFEQDYSIRTLEQDINFVNVGVNYAYQAEDTVLWVSELGLASASNEAKTALQTMHEKWDTSAYLGQKFYWQFSKQWYLNLGANFYSGFGDSDLSVTPFLGISYVFPQTVNRRTVAATSNEAKKQWLAKVNQYRAKQERYAANPPAEQKPTQPQPQKSQDLEQVAQQPVEANTKVMTQSMDTCYAALQVGYFKSDDNLQRMKEKMNGLSHRTNTELSIDTEGHDQGTKLYIINLDDSQHKQHVEALLQRNNIAYFRKQVCSAKHTV